MERIAEELIKRQLEHLVMVRVRRILDDGSFRDHVQERLKSTPLQAGVSFTAVVEVTIDINQFADIIYQAKQGKTLME